MAECRLPFSFNVVPKVPAAQGKRKRAQVEQEGDLPTPGERVVRRRMGGPNVTAQIHPLGNEQIHHPVPDIDHQDTPEVVQPCEGSTASLPQLPPPLVPPQNANSTSARLDATKPPNQPIAPPTTEGETAPTLTEVNPESGSITGGATIWLKGMDFPALFPLFARFGTAVVPTVSSLIAFVRLFLIYCPRHSATPTFLPVTCLPQPHQALSMLHYRGIHRQMRRGMELASPNSTM